MGRSLRTRTVRLYPLLLASAAALLILWVAAASAVATPVEARTGSAAGYAALPPGGGGTPTPVGCTSNYTYTVSTGTIVSGTLLVPGSQCGLCIVEVELPFPFTFYGQTYTSANLSTQGNMQFETEHLPQPGTGNECPLPEPLLGHAIIPHWNAWLSTYYHTPCQQYIGSPCGIYTSTTGTAPNRIFNIHWRLQVISTSQHTANFEARLYESTNQIDYVYGWVSYGGGHGAVGVQDGSDLFTQYSCDTGGAVLPGLLVSWHPPTCGATPTPSPTPTQTPPSTLTPTPTAATGTPPATPTATAGTPAATPTATAGTPAATHTPVPTAPATATPTACTVTFTDVPEGHTFYPYVRCLACRGIVQGYSDGTFRPDNHVTRGQVAKIVSESAGFDEEVPPSAWTFADVEYGSTFWVWVERLSNRAVMTGYPCGQDPNEPCDDQDRPYFRPNAGATRGQLAKIVVNAAGFTSGPPPDHCTFTDTCGPTTFGYFIELLVYNRPGAISGYPCGSLPYEPCDSEERPYFRPSNPLTRGQTSKVASGVFFPECSAP